VPVDLRGDGLLWLVNASILHPRGYALARDSITGALFLLGDGSEPWRFDMDCEEQFAAVNALLARAREHNKPVADQERLARAFKEEPHV
jgi:hypothetical protein